MIVWGFPCESRTLPGAYFENPVVIDWVFFSLLTQIKSMRVEIGRERQQALFGGIKAEEDNAARHRIPAMLRLKKHAVCS